MLLCLPVSCSVQALTESQVQWKTPSVKESATLEVLRPYCSTTSWFALTGSLHKASMTSPLYGVIRRYSLPPPFLFPSLSLPSPSLPLPLPSSPSLPLPLFPSAFLRTQKDNQKQIMQFNDRNSKRVKEETATLRQVYGLACRRVCGSTP